MTPQKFFLFFLLQWLIFAVLKVWLLTGGAELTGFQIFLYLLFTGIVTVALFRRFGVINYIEALFALFVWFFVSLFLDFIILTNFTSLAIFKSSVYWMGWGVVLFSAMVFHKKRHVYLRRELHAHHHGGHGDHGHGGGHKSHGDHSQQPHGHAQPGKHH